MQIFSQKVAATTGKNLVPPGPRVPATDAIVETEGLRAAVQNAAKHVADISKLSSIQHWHTQPVDHDVDILVVDRPGWITANASSLQIMLEPAFTRIQQTNEGMAKSISNDFAVGFSGAQVGALLAFLSTKILGQYEPFAAQAADSTAKPRLMMVAPNIMMVREELNLEPEDFRTWVSLHELTHVAQFLQAPWLAEHILQLATDFLLLNILPETSHNLTPQQKAEQAKQFESKITGVMSLLEGHANVIMDGVDRKLVPTVRTIRKRFDNRSANLNWLSQLMRKLFGLDAKAKQYKQGQAFVAAVVERVGIEQFNTVWETSENLPSQEELTDAEAWIQRVLG